MDGERFVRGHIAYTDDLGPAGGLHIAFVRSTIAHGDITRVDLSRAADMPGVVAVLDGRAAETMIAPRFGFVPSVLTGLDGPLKFPCLPVRTVTYWGEPVALIVAETAEQARRAAGLVDVVYDVKPVLLTIEEATRHGAPVLHPQLSSNVVMGHVVEQGNPDGVMRNGIGVVEGTVSMGRSSAVPLEPRACNAEWDRAEGRLTVRINCQHPHVVRAEFSRQLGIPESDIRVHTPPLGGAFGFRCLNLPEESLVCLMAIRLGRPVRWVEGQNEMLIQGAREYEMTYRASYEADGRVTALMGSIDGNVGAMGCSPASIMAAVAANAIPGGYDIGHFKVNWRAITTNKGPWNAARGFGKEAACLLLESIMEDVARTLKIDPVEVRRRNLLTSDRLPHRTVSMTLDSGDYPRGLDMVADAGRYSHWREVQRDLPSDGTSKIGIGIGFEVTPEGTDVGGTLFRGYETSTVRLDTSGHVTVLTGVTSPGTGSDTGIAQLVARQLGVRVEHIRVVQGDTDRTPFGGGSFSSRAVLTAGAAAWLAAGDLRQRLNQVAAVLLGGEASDIVATDGVYSVPDQPERAIPLSVLVHNYYALGAAVQGIDRAELEVTRTYGPDNTQPIPDANGRLQTYPTYAYSVHLAVVEVDAVTGVTALKQHTVLHDCGTIINQDLAECQVHGCVAMGIGMALLEEEQYDAAGVPTSFDFKRYMLPRIKDMPALVVKTLESPSPFSLLGTKGGGETGVGGTAAAIVAAIHDALGAAPGLPVRLPLTPEHALQLLDASRAAREGMVP